MKNFFHLVDESPIPFFSSSYLWLLMISFIYYLCNYEFHYMFLSYIILSMTSFSWFNDINLESKEGEHSNFVKDGLKMGMIMFIITEILFFVSWFWSFFHSSLSPTNDLGNEWPPFMLEKIDFFSIPTWNTFILLSSGISVSWSHNFFLSNYEIKDSMFITILLGIFFTTNQLMEYYMTNFTIADSIFGSCFFVTTGFHGLHVFIGTIFLSIAWFLIHIKETSFLTHNNLFNFSIWYWHFVDVVWLFLMFFIYIWSFI